jgi:hypothetical protein
MDKNRDSEERVEQFYRLLSAYGLTGKTQPMNRGKKSEIDKLFPDEEE